MKILNIEPSFSHIIETDEKEWPIYRRNSLDCWEQLMGESWEPVYNYSKLQSLNEAFDGYINDKNL